MKTFIKTLSLVVCFFMTASLSALAGGSSTTYYTKLNANATPTGAGLVYASTSKTAPADDAYQETVSVSNNGNDAVQNYFLFVKPAAGQRLEGWYTDADCTEPAETTKDGDVYTYSVTANDNATSAAAAAEFNIFAKFIEAVDAYSSTLNVHAVGADGCFVNVEKGEYGANVSASFLEEVNADHRYTVSVSTELPLDCRFVGWYTDEACTEFISRAKTIDYDVVATSLDADAPSQFHLYAKFEAFNVYQLRNGSFEEWETVSAGSTTGEEPICWNSFITATGNMASMVRAVQLRKDDTESVDGNYSARLNARSVMGIAMAQGNMTTGCINGGSMTATDANGNYNYTNEAGDEQAMYFTGRPDAMKVWIKSSCSGTIKIAAFLHEKGYFQDPITGNTSKLVPLVASGEIAPESNDLTWTEYTLPFTYESDANPYYALVSFATSSVPGKGSASDYMFIDNVTMVYNSELASAAYAGRTLTFDNGAASVIGDFDESLLALTSNGVAATIETAYDEETRILTICVKGQDYEYDTENIHVYTIEFVKSMGPQGDDVNGDLLFSEANNIDDLLCTTITFDRYYEVTPGVRQALAGVFDASGDPYAILYAPLFGELSVSANAATLQFVKIADLTADLQSAAKKALAKIGGFQAEGNATIVVAPYTLRLDNNWNSETIVKNFIFNGATPTGIESILGGSNATIYDLQGRRTNVQRGVFLQNGKKIVR